MYPNIQQQNQVEKNLCQIEIWRAESIHLDIRPITPDLISVHPIRSIPMDMIAEAVFKEAGIELPCPLFVPDAVIINALRAVCYRYDPPRERSDANQESTPTSPGGGVQTFIRPKRDGE